MHIPESSKKGKYPLTMGPTDPTPKSPQVLDTLSITRWSLWGAMPTDDTMVTVRYYGLL